MSPVVEDHQVVGGGVGGQGLPQHLHLCKYREGWGRPGFHRRGTLSPRKPVPEQTLAMFLGTYANSKDTVVQEKGSNLQNYF